MSEMISIPRAWVEEVVSALASATIIGMRSCREGDGLDYGNHDRLIRQAQGFHGVCIFPRSLPDYDPDSAPCDHFMCECWRTDPRNKDNGEYCGAVDPKTGAECLGQWPNDHGEEHGGYYGLDYFTLWKIEER